MFVRATACEWVWKRGGVGIHILLYYVCISENRIFFQVTLFFPAQCRRAELFFREGVINYGN